MTRIDSIEQFFRDHAGVEVTTLQITQATGTLAPSTKVSQLRDRGMDIRKTRDEWRKDGTRVCGYTYFDNRLAAAAATTSAATTPDLARPVVMTASPDAKNNRAAAATDPEAELFYVDTSPNKPRDHHDY